MNNEIGRKEDDDGVVVLTGHTTKGNTHTFEGTVQPPEQEPFQFKIKIKMGEEWTDGWKVTGSRLREPNGFFDDDTEREEFILDLATTAMEIAF